jgi:hypothetical protein
VQVSITSVADNQNITVSDGSLLQLGSKIYVHSEDYNRDSFLKDIEIANISGDDIQLSQALDFAPQIGDLLNGSDFLDGGSVYRLI